MPTDDYGSTWILVQLTFKIVENFKSRIDDHQSSSGNAAFKRLLAEIEKAKWRLTVHSEENEPSENNKFAGVIHLDDWLDGEPLTVILTKEDIRKVGDAYIEALSQSLDTFLISTLSYL